ncbi:hypothetical protein ACIRU8_32340 [Streptomyces sp. NPDC101175]|uniref:hypothetical protein n=1 Tax=Streptomyces sp. NPDC101175 TaxID=3366123 RepID=UPI003835EA7B
MAALIGAGLADARARLADGRGHEVPARILDLHHVWDFFRARLLPRRVRDLRRVLDVADELAWQCYGPVLALPGVRPKEPPLVAFSRTASPRAHRRGSAYQDLLPRGGIHTRQGREAAARLPFPVIEVPWYFGGHLPALLGVAHESAHHIEDDCGLGAEIHHRVTTAGLPPDRTAHWSRWAGEAFADVCASVVCRTAYAELLTDLLEPELPVDEQDFDGPHPPPAARVRLARAAASREPAETGEEAVVAAALLDGGYEGLGGRTLTELLTAPDDGDVPAGAERLLRGLPSGCRSAGAVLSAAAVAFQTDPEGYDTHGVGERAVDEVLRLRGTGTRTATVQAHPHDHADAGALLLAALDAVPERGPSRPVSP